MIKIDYNSQRDNINFDNQFKGSWQCFSTCAWMYLSHFCKDINSLDDQGLSEYIENIEIEVGSAPVAKKVINKMPWIKSWSSFWWDVQVSGINYYLSQHTQKNVVYKSNLDFDKLKNFLKYIPVIIGTRKMGGLKGGHIILALGIKDGNIICHDPYGNAITNYRQHNGSYVVYPWDYLIQYTGKKLKAIY